MVFTNDGQIVHVCMVLLDRLRMGSLGYWNQHGPTPLACDLMKRSGGPLSSGERVILFLCFSLWNGDRTLRFSDIQSLDFSHRDAIADLMHCHSSHDVDAWLEKYDRRAS